MLLRKPAGALLLKPPFEFQITTSSHSGIQADQGIQAALEYRLVVQQLSGVGTGRKLY